VSAPKRLADLLAGISYCCVSGSVQESVRAICDEARQVTPGSLFVARRGLHTDGHRFLDAALDKGATALVVEDVPPHLLSRVHAGGQTVIRVSNSYQALALIASAYYEHPSRSLRLVGITGTNGRMTTAYVVESILQAAGRTVGGSGTAGQRCGQHRLGALHTTPEAPCLQRFLRQMVDAHIGYAVIELSRQALVQERIGGCHFELCVFTNLGCDHYDYHSTTAAYVAAIARLFETFPARWHIVNLDDAYGQKLVRTSRTRLLTYGLASEATLKPLAVHSSLQGIQFTLPTTKGYLRISSALIGRHNVYSLLAGIGVAIALDIEVQAIERGIAQLRQVPGRLEPVDQGQDFHVLVDHARTPAALERVLRLVRADTPGRVITVFGCGGDRNPGKRPLMGKIATLLSDYTVITSDNPRTEDPQRIVDDIVAGVEPSRAYTTILDRRRAITYAMDMAQPQDTVLIAGKGHEAYQIIGHTRLHFDDRDVAREVLNNRC
jgi:UDP-N-acetylmuramoyl-L-alanyl-D-glutamate--2,6-diaminopimelate ligase